ncbi:hypothetical protein G7067_00715 [Leucobacter insecticola]|uniref:DUF7927 domain-containing protein n=1 Tax=Leucobacter insecticola TaxID=2714934 RepID=A0A6G8FGW3_9MICO|nr:hypothetical protein [Leucobacter insecticola]QIM15272.1 hypothetical protein G7067_00715 [Leucobacter insecticola]
MTITYSINTAGVDVDVYTTLPNSACVPLAGQDPECASLVTPVPPATRETPACVGPDCADLLPEYTKVLEGVGATLNADGEADYVVSIRNPYDELLHVELVDYLSDVLDDATIIGPPTVSVSTISVDRTDAAAWVIHGELQPGETVQLRYRIKVHSPNAAGNRILDNYIVPSTVDKPTACTPKPRRISTARTIRCRIRCPRRGR